jgi:two-component system chemotaxis sensor kinase CheA
MFPLSRFLDDHPDQAENPPEVGLITSWENKKCCLLVNQLVTLQQVVVKSLDSNLRKLQGISGGAILGDGKVGLILDIPNIVGAAMKGRSKVG